MHLCYLHAARLRQTGAITWEEYIHNLFARFRGIKYEEDGGIVGGYEELRRVDPWAFGIWTWSNQVELMEDTSSVEAVFNTYRRSTVADDVKDKYALLDESVYKLKNDGSPFDRSLGMHVRKSLAMLALQDRRADVLQFCFDSGTFPFNGYFHAEVEKIQEDEDPETFKVLKQSRYRKPAPPMTAEERWNSKDPAVIFDKGGRLPVDW